MHHLMERKGDFVGMRGAPRNDTFELGGIVGDGTDFHQIVFYALRVSHKHQDGTTGQGGGSVEVKQFRGLLYDVISQSYAD